MITETGIFLIGASSSNGESGAMSGLKKDYLFEWGYHWMDCVRANRHPVSMGTK